MALELKVEKSSITSDCKTLTVIDNTGTYDAGSNPGGYGAPNIARSSLYLKLFVTLKKSTGDEPQTISEYDENTESSWDISIANDGVYELYLFACLAWDSGTTYAINHVVYSAAQDKFYKSLQDSNTNNAVTDTNYWAEATVRDDFTPAFDASQTDVYLDIENTLVTCNSVTCRNQSLVDADCKCNPCETVSTYEKIRFKIEAAEIHAAQQAWEEAQKVIENVEDICSNVDCKTC